MRIFFIIAFVFLIVQAKAQHEADVPQSGKVFVASGLGFGFPVGDINQTLSPKVSNVLGLNIPLKSKRYFLYPVVDFLRFSYNESITDAEFGYKLQDGTSNLYGLSVMPGLNHFLASLRLYAYAGPSLHLLYEPRVSVAIPDAEATIEKITSLTGGLRGGVGAHYQFGDFYLFIESAYIRNFQKIQGNHLSVVTLHGGLKTDVTKLVDKIF